MKTLPLSEVKMKLSEILNMVDELDEEITITRKGRPAAVIVSAREVESWEETGHIKTDVEFMAEIKKGLKGLKKTRKLYSLGELLKDA